MTTITHTSLLRTYLRPRRGLVALVLLLLVLGTVGEIAGPLLLGRFIDAAAEGSTVGVLVTLALAAAGVAVVTQALTIVKTAAVARMAWSATNELREDLTLSTLAMGEDARADRSPGELVERIDGDSNAVREFLSDFVLLIVANAMFVVGVVVALVAVDWRLSLAVTVFTLATGTVFYLLRRYSIVDWHEAREASAQLWGGTEQQLSGLEELKRNGGTRFVLTSLTSAMDRLTIGFRRARTRGNRIFVATSAMVAVGQGAVLVVAVVLAFRGDIGLGGLFSTWFLLQLLEYPIDVLSKQLQHLQRATAGIERLHELMPVPDDRPAGTASAPLAAPTIELQDVSFAYGDAPVLHDVTLNVPAGSTTSIVGPTGGGKSTLVKLLVGLRTEYMGTITLDGTELCDIAPAALREHVALVPQHVHLFPGTVRENITLLQPADDAAIENALASLGLEPWLRGLPDGLDSRLEATSSMSAGQAQQLGIVRALLHPSRLLVLDEATARLDPEAERALHRAVADLGGERTLIVIAHRLSTALLADQLVVLEQGRVREVGSPGSLTADSASRLSRIIDADGTVAAK